VAETVTFRHRAAPVERVLAKLSEKVGLKLEAASTMRADVVVIDVKEAPVADLLRKIASVTSGEWVAEGEVQRLVPATGIRTREANDEAAQRLAQIRTAIRQRIKPEAAPTSPDEHAPDMDVTAAFASNPSEVAINALLSGIDAQAIANLGPNERVVYSSRPTAMQMPLPSNAPQALAKMIADHNQALKTSGAANAIDDSPEIQNMPSFLRDMITAQTKPIGVVEKALLCVTSFGMGGFDGVNLELRLYDAQGKVAYRTTSMLQMNNSFLARATDMANPDAPAAGGTPLELSEDTKTVNKIFEGGRGNQLSIKISAEAKPLVYRTDLHDPLSFLATDMVMGLAKKRKQNLVACLPDSMVDGVSMAWGSRTTIGMAEDLIKTGGPLRALADPNTLVLKPSAPAATRAERLDREALAALMAVVEAKGIPSLEDMAAYALKAPNPIQGGIGQVYVMTLAPGSFSQSLDGFTDWNALRFYGMLTPQARTNLAAGGRIPFASLSGGQAAVLRQMAFGAMADIQIENPNVQPEEFRMPGILRMMGGLGGGNSDYRSEPTELMPRGLPGNGFVSATVEASHFVMPVVNGEGGSGPMSVLGADELAMFQMFKEDTNMGMVGDLIPTLDQVRLGTRRIWNFTFQLTPEASMATKLNDNESPKGETITMAALPAAFQKTIDARLQALKKSPLGMLGGMMGGMRQATPPPGP
jgi:hypothetical protein